MPEFVGKHVEVFDGKIGLLVLDHEYVNGATPVLVAVNDAGKEVDEVFVIVVWQLLILKLKNLSWGLKINKSVLNYQLI